MDYQEASNNYDMLKGCVNRIFATDNFYHYFSLSFMIFGGFFLIVFIISALLAGCKQKKISKCSEKECRFFYEETGCLLGSYDAETCPYKEDKNRLL